MNVHVLDIPETTSDLADWLEGHLVGLHLGALVAELLAVHGNAQHRPLDEIFGDDLPHVIFNGLKDSNREQIQELLRTPTALLELQERIILDGGPHWEARARSNPEMQETVAAGWTRLQAAIAPGAAKRVAAASVAAAPGRRSSAWKTAILSVAALVLVTVMLTQVQFGPPGPQVAHDNPPVKPVAESPVAWGWARPGALPTKVPADQYLASLADTGEEWSRKRPSTPAELEKRLKEFRIGCETLIAAEHEPLKPVDREWLKERCLKWKAKIDGHLQELAQTQDVTTVRGHADATVKTLAEALRTRKVS